MPRRFNSNKNRRENLLKRKRTYMSTNEKFETPAPELTISQRNSRFGAQSGRGLAFKNGGTARGNPSKT